MTNYLNSETSKLDKIFNNMQYDIENSIYNKVSTIEGSLLFKYIVLFVILLKLFNYINISSQQFIAILFTGIIIYIVYDKDKIYENTEKKSVDFKLNSIYPPQKHFKGHNKIIKFVYSIKEFRIYNIDTFDNMLKCIDNFLKIYEDIQKCILYPHMHIDIMKDNAKNAINYLHSIIHNIETNKIIMDKHMEAVNVLNKLLKNYINKSIDKANNQLKKNGYNIMSKKIYKDELESVSVGNSSIESVHFELLQ